MPLPLSWIDRIFEKLTLTYGEPFLNKWRDMDIAAVKTDWLNELDGMERHPEAIAYALQNLPERPVNVIEFRALCRRAPMPEVKLIEGPRANPEKIKAEVAKLMPALKASRKEVDRRGWARALIARHEAGEKLRPISLKFAREALENEQ